MRAFAAVCLLLFFALNGFSQSSQKDPTNRIIENLSKIESLYFKSLTAQERKEAVSLLNETRNLVVNNPVPKERPGDLSAFNVLSEESFLSLYESVRKELSDDAKNTLILAIGENGKITCTHLARLIALYTFDAYRERLLKAIADNIIDPVNIGLVLKHFDSSITRDQLAVFFRNR